MAHLSLGSDVTQKAVDATLILPRSSLPLQHGLIAANAPGLIDSHFVGHEIGVIVHNLKDEPVGLKAGMRIAQAVFASLQLPEIVEVRDPLAFDPERLMEGEKAADEGRVRPLADVMDELRTRNGGFGSTNV